MARVGPYKPRLPRAIQLTKYRLQAGLTQAELGEKIGAHQVSIAQYERGVVTPSLPTAARLALALGTTVEAILAPVPRRGRPKGSRMDPSRSKAALQARIYELEAVLSDVAACVREVA